MSAEAAEAERRANVRENMGASRSRWTEAEGWTTPPEDTTPMSPRPRKRDSYAPAVVALVILGLMVIAAILILFSLPGGAH